MPEKLKTTKIRVTREFADLWGTEVYPGLSSVAKSHILAQKRKKRIDDNGFPFL
jgi:hypothetical protein